MTKTYDFFYKPDDVEKPLNEQIQFSQEINVEDAMRAALKVFNDLLK